LRPCGVLSVLAFALGAARGAGATSWSMGPAPGWVAPLEIPPPPSAPPEDVSSGTYDLAFDHQIRAGDATSDEYVRRVVQVLSTSGVQNASEISVEFDPASEHLVLHQVRILRSGRDVSSFRAGDVSVIRPERESEEGIYSGTLSAVIFLRDVRPGDILDYAYTVLGTSPSPPPSFAETLEMAYAVPVGRLRHRLLWPARRTLHVKAHGSVAPPGVEPAGGGVTAYTWTQDAVPAVLDEGDLPDWFDPYPAVELSEFDSWGQVAGWTAELYDAVDEGSPSLDALLAEWSGAGALEERALRAVRFVQDEVRYLGLEIGPGAYVPRSPASVLARRYGDCKDKSLLLSALLRRMGLDARPALVSTRAGRGLDGRLPSPLAFDHVIMRLKLPGETRWIDPTTAHQGGRLREIVAPAFERALVVDASTSGLEPIPQPIPGEPTTLVDEQYAVPAAGPAILRVKALYAGADADAMRARLADTSSTDLASSYLNHYAAAWPSLESQGALGVSDQRDANRVEIQTAYRLPEFWTSEPRTLEAWSLADVVEPPATVRRAMPLAVAHPTRLRHRLALHLPAEPDDVPGEARVEDKAFRFVRSCSLEGATLIASFDYASLADSVPPAELQGHLQHLERARAGLKLSVGRPTGRRAARRRMALAGLTAAPVLWAACALVRARRRRPPAEPA
jgi:transglutaminase-like putative cysteine protease